ncbi:hypothetical protein BDW74DRAFT_158803 [Aspergillus multicolor]|uniref:uncharacterized protein n=1 Tax=Aspergillus multicolor TaxID=41759 RepID=UPI003CCD1A27
MAEIAISEILISDLPTKEVTLAPKQVTIVRDIPTTVQPGQNEITIYGLDARVDCDSIRVEGSGHGLVTITDIQTSIVPNRLEFDDSVSDSESSESGEDDFSEDEDSVDDPVIQATNVEMEKIQEKMAMARSRISAAFAVMNILDNYGNGLQADEKKDVKKLEEFLDTYVTRRGAEAKKHHEATTEVTVREKELAKLQKQIDKRKKLLNKDRLAASKAIQQQKEKRAKEREQKKKQKERKRAEQRQFWAKQVGRVVVSLDSLGQNFVTPGSSRRSSIGEKTVRGEEMQREESSPVDVTLRLSYIVPGSGWFSRYDLSINSPSSSARLSYRAEFKNSSSETWRDAQVTLSTSQASFSGLGVRIPTLDTWNIKLATMLPAKPDGPSWEKILDAPAKLGPLLPPTPKASGALFGAPAPQSLAARRGLTFEQLAEQNIDAKALFGNPFSSGPSFGQAANHPAAIQTAPQVGASLFGGPAASYAPERPQPEQPFGSKTTSGFGSVARPTGGGLFGQPAQAPEQNQASRSLFGNVASSNTPAAPEVFDKKVPGFGQAANDPRKPFEKQENTTSTFASMELEEDDADADTRSLASTIEHQDTIKQDYGLTTAYELPGRRTLVPSLASRRHVLAELDLHSVNLTYVIVPKHRNAAFLRARIKNTSSLTLQPGRMGITVDGSFIGTITSEACGPNVFFNIPLGIDPAIEVKYAKPTVKPLSGAMFFNKEDGANFRRSCRVKNTKSNAVDVIVLDQIPVAVSEDEKLRVRVLQPAGLEKGGDEADIKMEKKTGRATASLGKNGEVKWTLRLEPKEEVRLLLEYETKVPSGSEVMSVSA